MDLTRRKLIEYMLKGAAVASVGLASGCVSNMTSSNSELDGLELKKTIQEVTEGKEKLVDGVLYVPLERIVTVTAQNNIDLSKLKQNTFWVNDVISIKYEDGTENVQRIAKNGSIDTPYGRIENVTSMSISTLDKKISELANAPVQVFSSSLNEYDESRPFTGAVNFYDYGRGGLIKQARVLLPKNLGGLTAAYDLGKDSKYVALVFPIGDNKDIDQTVGVTTTNEVRRGRFNRMGLMNNSTALFLPDNNSWDYMRRTLREVGGALGEVRGVTAPPNGIMTDISSYKDNIRELREQY